MFIQLRFDGYDYSDVRGYSWGISMAWKTRSSLSLLRINTYNFFLERSNIKMVESGISHRLYESYGRRTTRNMEKPSSYDVENEWKMDTRGRF